MDPVAAFLKQVTTNGTPIRQLLVLDEEKLSFLVLEDRHNVLQGLVDIDLDAYSVEITFEVL